MNTKNKIFWLSAFLLVVFFIFIIMVNLIFKPKTTTPPVKTQPILIPTPTTIDQPHNILNPPIPGQSEEYKRGIKKEEEEDRPILLRGQDIANLRNSLPYNGLHFSLVYNINNNTYGLYLDKKFPEKGREEFNEYLRTFNLNSSLIDLIIY